MRLPQRICTYGIAVESCVMNDMYVWIVEEFARAIEKSGSRSAV
jgi:hypothetical protein